MRNRAVYARILSAHPNFTGGQVPISCAKTGMLKYPATQFWLTKP